jgi:MFS family permease
MQAVSSHIVGGGQGIRRANAEPADRRRRRPVPSRTVTTPARIAPDADVRAAVRGTYVAFIGAGFAFASWAARIPQVRDHLHLNPSELGLMLLAIAGGSGIALPLSGPVVHRFGASRTVAAMALLLSAGLGVAAGGYQVGVLPVAIGLFLLGFANGAWDVGMNVHAAVVERHLGRSIMPRFHAGFSVGTVAGALIGTAMVAADVPVTAHLAAVAGVVALTVPLGARAFLPDEDEASGDPSAVPGEDDVGQWAGWTERRTLLVGVLVLAFAFAEGTANDWISLAVIDGYGTSATVGTLTLAVFLSSMTAGRWLGPALLDRYGRVPVIRALTALAIGGLLLFVFGTVTATAFIGAVLWGVGVSLGFPVGMSAGADEPRRAASRVSVIASIGYCAFLTGPPLIGFLGQQYSVLKALTSVAVVLGLAALITGNLRPAGAATAPRGRAGPR